MNNANIPVRAAYWDQVERDLTEHRATNGIGWAVHALLLPAGWTQTGITRDTSSDALADLAASNDSIEELMVYEILAVKS